ncbi:hypothetical protein AB1N83_012079 [Pleurotus pulmonarius]
MHPFLSAPVHSVVALSARGGKAEGKRLWREETPGRLLPLRIDCERIVTSLLSSIAVPTSLVVIPLAASPFFNSLRLTPSTTQVVEPSSLTQSCNLLHYATNFIPQGYPMKNRNQWARRRFTATGTGSGGAQGVEPSPMSSWLCAVVLHVWLLLICSAVTHRRPLSAADCHSDPPRYQVVFFLDGVSGRRLRCRSSISPSYENATAHFLASFANPAHTTWPPLPPWIPTVPSDSA